MSPCRMYVTQYARNGDATTELPAHLPRRWELCIQTQRRTTNGSKSRGTTFKITGAFGGPWGYKCEVNREYANDRAWAGSVYVGTVEDADVPRIDQLLRTVALKNGYPSWHSHDWVWAGLLLLRESNYRLELPATFHAMQAKMQAVRDEKWQVGSDSD
ncbi:hypothetical protein FOMPIDRAFT_1022648 [Fomitopsis schrenkii]|uniref:Uncharacterized protein n=1 Tax=Fomitopsis schrenkii TaxID=2126942 RepID=S8EDI5_FOMSC|nr:hypothetical protein FOMPIDRAFT_1022648 [Fomitopsis schrenkii]